MRRHGIALEMRRLARWFFSPHRAVGHKGVLLTNWSLRSWCLRSRSWQSRPWSAQTAAARCATRSFNSCLRARIGCLDMSVLERRQLLTQGDLDITLGHWLNLTFFWAHTLLEQGCGSGCDSWDWLAHVRIISNRGFSNGGFSIANQILQQLLEVWTWASCVL